jgi:serine/threonine protein kinase
MESGTKLGHYEIGTLLGKGGMGEVWRARDTKLGREVAIKTLAAPLLKRWNRHIPTPALLPKVFTFAYTLDFDYRSSDNRANIQVHKGSPIGG